MVIPPGLVPKEPPRSDLKSGFVYWDEWLEQHFDMRAVDGTRAKVERISWSNVISEQQAKGSPDFYLKSVLQPGVKYDFDYIPYKKKDTRVRYSFTAPKEKVSMVRENFFVAKKK